MTEPRRRWLQVGLELVIVAAVFAGAYRLANRHLAIVDVPTFIEWELKPAVMLSCGYGFVRPGNPGPAVDSFIARKSGSVTCQEFAWGGAPLPAVPVALANRYSLYGAALAMRLNGISWATLDAYLSFLFAIAAVFIYGLYRMVLTPVLAVAGIFMVAVSPMLIEIAALRDFAKLPCFAALWLALAWVVKRGLRDGARATVVPMVVAGGLLGVAIGFRMDALVFLPVLIAVVLLVVPGYSWHDLRWKAAAVVLQIVMFGITGLPILRALSSGSNSAHFLVLGMVTRFDRVLAIDPAPYDVGAQYADGFAYTVIVSHALLKQGERLPISLGSPEYDRVGGRMLTALATSLPADIVTRGLGATWQLFRFPFDWRIRDFAEKMAVVQERPFLTRAMAWRTSVLEPFAERELLVTLAVLGLAAAFNWRLGVLGLALVLYFCGYSMMQFSRRHMFHLDVIPMLVALLTVQLPLLLAWRIGLAWRRSREAGLAAARAYARELGIGSAVLFAAVLFLLASLAAARWWQERNMTAVIEQTLSTAWVPSEVIEEPLAATMMTNGRPSQTWYEMYQANPEQWRTATLLRVAGVVPAGAEAEGTGDLRQQYFKVILDGRCGASTVTVGLKYSGAGQTADYEFTRAITVAAKPGAASYVLTPAYYHLGSTWNRFDGFAVPAAQRACVTGIERATQPASLPWPVMAFALAPDWRDGRLYQRLLDRPAVSASASEVDPLPSHPSVHYSGWWRRASHPLATAAPPLDQWQAIEGVSVAKNGNRFTVATNHVPGGYQLLSPPLDVPPRRTLSFQIVGAIEQGEICVGVLGGGQQRWLLQPTSARMGLVAETGDYQQVHIVFSNCVHPPGRFTVRAITYEPVPQP